MSSSALQRSGVLRSSWEGGKSIPDHVHQGAGVPSAAYWASFALLTCWRNTWSVWNDSVSSHCRPRCFLKLCVDEHGGGCKFNWINPEIRFVKSDINVMAHKILPQEEIRRAVKPIHAANAQTYFAQVCSRTVWIILLPVLVAAVRSCAYNLSLQV